MKSTGIIRKVDELGRVVLPRELRRSLDIEQRDPLEIYVDGDKIILQKYKANHACIVTGDVDDDNISLANGQIVLSPEGAEEILEALKEYTSKK